MGIESADKKCSSKDDQIKEIHNLEKQLRESRAHLNNLVILLDTCESFLADEESDAYEVAAASLQSLKRTFSRLVDAGDICGSSTIPPSSPPAAAVVTARMDAQGQSAEGSGEGAGVGPNVSSEEAALYAAWLRSLYHRFLRTCLRSMLHPHHALQVVGLLAAMAMVCEHGEQVDTQLLAHVVRCLVNNRNASSPLLTTFTDRFLPLHDILFYSLRTLSHLLKARVDDITTGHATDSDSDTDVEGNCEGNGKSEGRGEAHREVCKPKVKGGVPWLGEGTVHRVTVPQLCRNAVSVLLAIRPPLADDQLGNFSKSTRNHAPDKLTSPLAPKRKRIHLSASQAATMDKLSRCGTYRKELSSCWLPLLKLRLPLDVLKQILTRLHTRILPALTNPLLLSDFLTDAYNAGGMISILALNGLFVLITKHNLEYASFFPKLYALLQPAVLHSKYRARFFILLDLFLSSTQLPVYLVAAFMKRLARLALTAAPAGALLALSVVYNLIKRHPAATALIHNTSDDQSAAAPSVTHQQLMRQALAAQTASGSYKSSNDPVTLAAEHEAQARRHGGKANALADRFDPDEEDPARANAIGSSLWELEMLRQHYCANVARVAAAFSLPITASSSELDMHAAAQCSYNSLVEAELKAASKRASTALAYTAFVSVFPSAPPPQHSIFSPLTPHPPPSHPPLLSANTQAPSTLL